MFKDKNTLVGLLLIFSILIVFSILNTPSKEEIEKHKQEQETFNGQNQEIEENNVETIEEEPTQILEEVVENPLENNNKPSSANFNKNHKDNSSITFIENNLMKIGISSTGGNIKYLQLKDYLKYDKSSLMLIDENFYNFGLNFFYQNKLISTNELEFKPFFYNSCKDNNIISTANNDTLYFGMKLFPNNNNNDVNDEWIEFKYSIADNSYVIGFEIVFHNMTNYISNLNFIDFEMLADINQQEKSKTNEKAVTTMFYGFLDGDVDYLSESKDDKEFLQTKTKWISFKQQFFSLTLISENGFQTADIEAFEDKTKIEEDDDYIRTLKASLSIPIDKANSFSIPMKIYAGPNKYNILNKFDLGLERQIPLGWSFFLLHWINRYAVIPVFNYLEGFNMNYGIIILILTLLLKTILFPIAYKTYLSSARMKVLKPDIEEIGKKFPKKEDSMKKQQATMELYKKAGVNPMAGCLPMLLQLPILIAMFRFFPASIELRQQAFLWADDLSTYDSILELGFNIPFYGSHVSLFTLLMTISTIIYTRLNSNMMGSTNTMPGMKTMMYLMPIMFLGFFNSFSSALSYYYFLTNIITFGQMAIFNKLVDEDGIREKIQANKKKPVKKSNFQKRLEDMAKKSKK